MHADAIHTIDDEPGNDANGDGKKGNHDANRDIPGHNGRTGFPDEAEYKRDILERAYPVAPGAPDALQVIGSPAFGFARCV
jgi:hypothetical protein